MRDAGFATILILFQAVFTEEAGKLGFLECVCLGLDRRRALADRSRKVGVLEGLLFGTRLGKVGCAGLWSELGLPFSTRFVGGQLISVEAD